MSDHSITPREAVAQDLLAAIPGQWQAAARIRAIVNALGSQLQSLSDDAWDVLNVALSLQSATGDALDMWGKLLYVGRPPSTGDTEYRALLQAEILVRRSQGRAEQILAIAVILFRSSAVRYTLLPPAAYGLEAEVAAFPSGPQGTRAIDRLTRATAAGVGLDAVSVYLSARTFGWEDDDDALAWDVGVWAEGLL